MVVPTFPYCQVAAAPPGCGTDEVRVPEAIPFMLVVRKEYSTSELNVRFLTGVQRVVRPISEIVKPGSQLEPGSKVEPEAT